MRLLYCHYMGFEIFLLATGEYEVFLGDKGSFSSLDLNDVFTAIEEYRGI